MVVDRHRAVTAACRGELGEGSYAAIDVGTNSARLLVARIVNGRLLSIADHLEATRLGEGLLDGYLSPQATYRTVLAVAEFRRIVDRYMGDHSLRRVRMVATSAAREAKKNIGQFCRSVKQASGLDLEVISSDEEAYLSYLGVVSVQEYQGWPVVVDIGGGSTEITWWEEGAGLRSISFPVGAVRCLEGVLVPGVLAPPDWNNKGEKIVVVGGTVTTLASIEQSLFVYEAAKISGYVLTRGATEMLLTRLKEMTLAERQGVPGLDPRRADIIVPGLQILLAVMEGLKASEVTVSEAGILHGIVCQLATATVS